MYLFGYCVTLKYVTKIFLLKKSELIIFLLTPYHQTPIRCPAA